MAEDPRRAIELVSRLRARGVTAGRLVRAIVERAQATEITFLAAAVAYYAFLSLLPALLLVLSVGTALGGDALADMLVGATRDLLTPTGGTLVREAIDNAAGRAGATVVGVILLVWSVLKVFRGLNIAFLMVYGSEGPASLDDQIIDGVVAALGIGVGLVIMFGLGAALSATELNPLLDVVGIVVLPSILAVVFLPLYYVFPDTSVSLREAIPGTLVAAVGWTVLQAGFQIYAANAGQYQAYGVLGGILLLVIWFYLAATVILLGAVVNVVLAGRQPPMGETPILSPKSRPATDSSADRQLQQSPGPQGYTTPMASEEDTDDPLENDGGGVVGRGDRAAADRRGDPDADDRGIDPAGAPDITDLRQEVDRLRSELDEFERDVDGRTVGKSELKAELERYVRRRMRRGHARGWGPYLVLLYGTVLTLGAFYWLDGLYAIGAMLVLALSTLGLYVLFVLFGIGLNVLGVPARAIDAYRRRRK